MAIQHDQTIEELFGVLSNTWTDLPYQVTVHAAATRGHVGKCVASGCFTSPDDLRTELIRQAPFGRVMICPNPVTQAHYEACPNRFAPAEAWSQDRFTIDDRRWMIVRFVASYRLRAESIGDGVSDVLRHEALALNFVMQQQDWPEAVTASTSTSRDLLYRVEEPVYDDEHLNDFLGTLARVVSKRDVLLDTRAASPAFTMPLFGVPQYEVGPHGGVQRLETSVLELPRSTPVVTARMLKAAAGWFADQV